MTSPTGKPTARSYSAASQSEKGMSPLQWSDKCFLSSSPIGETDPRGFYQGSSAMMLCHRGCLNIMNTHGGKPADYHRAMNPPAPPPPEPVPSAGPAWMNFATLPDLILHVREVGDIPSHVKVTIAGQVVQGE